MTSKYNRARLLYHIELCVSFQSHWWIQPRLKDWQHSIRVKSGDCLLSRVTFKFHAGHWKTIGHLFYATSSFMHHFKAIGEFKLELQSGNAQFESKSVIFGPVWPWDLTSDLEKQQGTSPKQHQKLCIFSSSYVNSNWRYSPETV